MTLAELFSDSDFRFHMRLQRGDAAEFFRATPQHDAMLAERWRWLESDPHAYAAVLPDADPMIDESVELFGRWGVAATRAARSGLDQILSIGRAVEPDWMLLKPDATGTFSLRAGCVCFPSSWALAEKMGRPVEAIHGGVPGLNDQLARSIYQFLRQLQPHTAWLRTNWGLSRSAELNQHPSRALPRLDATVTAEEVWLRIEHQALVALPTSGGVLFGIRIANHALAEVKRDAEVCARLSRALRTMPDDVAHYKGVAKARETLLKLLAA